MDDCRKDVDGCESRRDNKRAGGREPAHVAGTEKIEKTKKKMKEETEAEGSTDKKRRMNLHFKQTLNEDWRVNADVDQMADDTGENGDEEIDGTEAHRWGDFSEDDIW